MAFKIKQCVLIIVRSIRKHFAVFFVGLITFIALAFVASLYLPTIFSDFSRVEFSIRTDCKLIPTLIEINSLEPPDAFIFISYEGFANPKCNKIIFGDETDVSEYEERSFLKTLMYSDDYISGIPTSKFEHSDFHVEIDKDKLKELYGSKEKTASDNLTLEFVAKNAFIKTSFSRYVLPIFPGIAAESADKSTYNKTTRIIVRAPKGFIFSSSSPLSPTSLNSREDGVIETWFDYKLKEPGFVVYFENAKGAAIGELMLFLTSGVFGFAVGFIIDRIISSRR